MIKKETNKINNKLNINMLIHIRTHKSAVRQYEMKMYRKLKETEV